MVNQQIERAVTTTAVGELLGRVSLDESRVLRSEVPSELAEAITEDYSEEDRQRLAEASVQAALAGVRPSSKYAYIIARGLAADAVRYALGIKPLPKQEGDL